MNPFLASTTPARLAVRGDLLDFTADPGWASPAELAGRGAAAGIRWRPDHWLMIEQGRIVGAEPAATSTPGADWQRIDHRGRLILPGFIDTHVHSPQLDVIASHGTELLDWLETYTFPAEQRYADEALAVERSALFLDALLGHGTTSAVVFPTVHRVSAEALLGAAHARGMRLVAGKVLMDRHAPPALCDDVIGAEADSRALIERWHGRGRLAYALTVRFAPTSTPAQLAMAGRLLAEVPGLYMQTHVAENRDEVRWVAELFPEARSYLDVYHRAGLLNGRSVLAHGIWLDDTDRRLLADTGAQIAFCPSSNLFLGSGLLDWPALEAAGARVSVASDVGGGTSLSMQRTLADGYKVLALQGHKLSAWKALYGATAGAALALGLEGEIGSFAEGCCADLVVWDWARGPVGEHRDRLATGLHERLFAWLTLSDERHLVQVLVAGRDLTPTRTA
ncbi:guanine deaminase [Sphaerotilus hippei]|uniref:Guanine deaminase n=1 Tax=Sphaerotilus hippei TaxID=744406 RepID=A0A318H9V8_9BURK|nr:guanine deaminase [Sphaerotilus hippei]PXW97077.1 guanine deaminase [Sphaerotilus hippei]